jgi:hypothetical protein
VGEISHVRLSSRVPLSPNKICSIYSQPISLHLNVYFPFPGPSSSPTFRCLTGLKFFWPGLKYPADAEGFAYSAFLTKEMHPALPKKVGTYVLYSALEADRYWPGPRRITLLLPVQLCRLMKLWQNSLVLSPPKGHLYCESTEYLLFCALEGCFQIDLPALRKRVSRLLGKNLPFISLVDHLDQHSYSQAGSSALQTLLGFSSRKRNSVRRRTERTTRF